MRPVSSAPPTLLTQVRHALKQAGFHLVGDDVEDGRPGIGHQRPQVRSRSGQRVLLTGSRHHRLSTWRGLLPYACPLTEPQDIPPTTRRSQVTAPQAHQIERATAGERPGKQLTSQRPRTGRSSRSAPTTGPRCPVPPAEVSAPVRTDGQADESTSDGTIGSWAAHLVRVTRKEENMHPAPDRSEILETGREGPQVWSGRPTVSDRSTPTLG